ncbi:MAG: hypothetical protein LAT68_04135 [Cyclobacteriaceae bacterium]|nr:hypothetical protein [Cyclobacteriaceae bacterium]MCH8515498.1 hypothetical protein [Cyclobacteriaceae bacterium]
MCIIWSGDVYAQQAVPVKLKTVRPIKALLIDIPEDFQLMPEQEVLGKYESYRLPVAVFTSPYRDVDLSINFSSTQWQEGDHELMQKFFKSSIRQIFMDVNFLEETIQEINGEVYVVFRFESLIEGDPNSLRKQADRRTYHHLMYLAKNGKTLLFNFNCDLANKKRWEPVANEIFSTVKVKKSL